MRIATNYEKNLYDYIDSYIISLGNGEYLNTDTMEVKTWSEWLDELYSDVK